MKTTLVLVVISSLMTVLHAVDTSKPFELTTLLGEKYKECRISKVTPEGLTILHQNGVAKVSFSVLDEEWQEQFGYDPERAREFAQAEEKKRGEIEVKRAEMARERAAREEAFVAGLAAEERQRNEAEAKAAQDQQAATATQRPLAPLPGDASPDLSAVPPQPVYQTEVVVPTVTPVGDPFSPTKIRSRSYIFSDGVSSGLYYGSGYPYGYGYGVPYQPVYAPQFHHGHPYTTPCLPGHGFHGSHGHGATIIIRR